MDIDLAALRALERERGISLDIIVPAIEQALLLAYQRTEGHHRHARAELDRKTGHVVIWAREEHEVPAPEGEVDEEGNPARPTREVGPEYDDTPDGFGRIAATTAKQVILQRLRDAEDDASLGEFSGKEGDIVSGVDPAGSRPPRRPGRPRRASRRCCRRPSRCPARTTRTASGSVPASSSVAQGHARPADRRCRARTPTWSRSSSRSRCPRSPTAPSRSPRIAREAGHRTKIAVRSTVPGVNAKGACIGPMGQRVRAVMAELHGEKIDIVDWSEDPAEIVAHALSPARVASSRSST